MIEQKLDRIIELLEIIAAKSETKKRENRASIYNAERVTSEQLKTLKGTLTFQDICEQLQLNPNRSTMVWLGRFLTDNKIKQTRTKYKRYYHFD